MLDQPFFLSPPTFIFRDFKALVSSKSSPLITPFAVTLPSVTNLATFYSNNNQKQRVEDLYIEALKIRKALAKNNLMVYRYDVASTLTKSKSTWCSISKFFGDGSSFVKSVF
jgi:hypothetical protein